MIPCLYAQSETAFDTNGIGKLADCISCSVTEKRNSSYELELEYPSGGIHADEIAEGGIILAQPFPDGRSQPFRIYKITTPISGILNVYARHISYRLNFVTVSPFSAEGSEETMSAISEAASLGSGFSFETDIRSDASFALNQPASIRNCRGGIDGSVLDTFGGEYEWDRYTVILHRNRGADNGVRIVYGKNLVDFTMEKNIEDVITGVHPYWESTEDGTLVELPEKVVVLDEAAEYQKISILDCSSAFAEEPTEEDLRSYAQSYLDSTTLTEPELDIDIDFAQLWQIPGYEDIAEAESVSLCDTVHVYVTKLGIEVSCKVTETEYNVLLERYTSITLSNSSSTSRNGTLAATLSSISDTAATALKTAEASVSYRYLNAN
ncbi:MAG: phage tail protein, partial [Clostridiales bacterium]|nr:phage tail protein [Clostridiales bacterium]